VLDVLVDTIARESPDVVCLQEVVRGWMIDEQHDRTVRVGPSGSACGTRSFRSIGDSPATRCSPDSRSPTCRRVSHYALEPGIKASAARHPVRCAPPTAAPRCTTSTSCRMETFVRQEQCARSSRDGRRRLPRSSPANERDARDIEIRCSQRAGFDDPTANGAQHTTTTIRRRR